MKYIFLYIFILIVSINIPLFSQNINSKGTNKDTLSTKTKAILVTAMRYPENIFEIPLAVTLINKESLLNIRGYGFADGVQYVPGVLIQSRFGNQDERVTIRGFGSRGAGDRSNAGTSRGIKVLIDNIPETEPDGRTSFDNIDLSLASNVEIIRSNASAIWGNAAGGILNISTVPVFSEPFIKADFMAGSYGFQKYMLQTGTNIGLGKIFASVSSSKFDGYRTNSNSERLIFNLGVNSMLDSKTLLGVYLLGSSNRYNIPGPLTQSQFDSLPEMANPTYLQRQERRNNRIARIGMTLDHYFDDNNSLSSMAYVAPKFLQRSERNTFRDFTRYHIGGSSSYKNSQNITSDIKNICLIGFDEAYQDGAILFYYLSPDAQRDSLKQDKSEGANSLGAFIQDEIILYDKFTVLLGARYDLITYYNQMYYEDGVPFSSKFYQDKTFSRVTPKAGLSYRFDATHSIYFNLGGGVEVPAGNEVDPSPQDSQYQINPLLEPIVSTTIELGSKNYEMYQSGLIKNISYEIALYMINTTNEIIPYSGGAFYFSAGKTERLGFELGTGIQFKYGLSFNGAFTYSANKYIDYKVDSVYYNKQGSVADYKNNKIAGMPEMYYNAGIRYTIQSLSGLYAELSVNGIGKYFADDANQFTVPNFNVLNGSIGLSEPIKIAGGLSIRAFALLNNLLNQKYAASSFINPDIDKATNQPKFLEPGLPRNFVLGLSLGWN